jgi:[ribosomal protein S18]-alanine N-acetyltransferase
MVAIGDALMKRISPPFRLIWPCKEAATRLMRELLGRAIDEGMICSTLEVRAGNEAAIKLYEKLGYKVTAERKKYYPDNREDALIMWLYDLV